MPERPPAGDKTSPVAQLNERSREIFRHIVDAYFETGDPVGSRTISRRAGVTVSPATIRNVMADLEEAGLLYAPHTSAGRLPTESGLKMFVHGLLEIGALSEDERRNVEARIIGSGKSMEQVLQEASAMLSGLSRCAGIVVSPKIESALRHIEFVSLGPGRALAVIVFENGLVENRLMDVPVGLAPSTLVEATNYLSARLIGRTLGEARQDVRSEIEEHRTQLDAISQKLVEDGLAMWSGAEGHGSLIIRGQSQLLEDVRALEDLEQVRLLFQMLETKEAHLRLLEAAHSADGVQIFIGADNHLFRHTGTSMIIAPYSDREERIIGAIGVVGPTRMNYARIIPLVDYTAKVIGRLIG